MNSSAPLTPEGRRESPPVPPKPEVFEGPVTWLLGSKLLREIGWIALYTAFGRRLGGLDWMSAAPIAEGSDEKDEFWFDYIADSGDSQKATYNVAYLCLSDLWVASGTAGGAAHFEALDGGIRLPRGEFLLVGGDTAYHLSNIRTLLQRFRNPFAWAHRELVAAGRASAARVGGLYAIPGNHDYYDSLHGFNRQFRRPAVAPGTLDLPGFERRQEASYVALDLPFGWWLFGLDAQNGEIDFRQREFFRGLLAEPGVPRKLILATPEPATVFDRRADPDGLLVRTLRELKLPTPFLDGPDQALPPDHYRLDLAGDVHYYARYWGTGDGERYASVVSGLGGAFLHPSHTQHGELTATCQYPPADASREAINAQLFNPIRIARGGNVPVVGALLGLVLFLAWDAPGSGWFLKSLTYGVWELLALHRPASPAAPDLPDDSFSVLSSGFLSLLLGVSCATVAIVLLRRHHAHVQAREPVPRPWGAYLCIILCAAAPFLSEVPWAEKERSSLTVSLLLFVFHLFGVGAFWTAIWHREDLDERAKRSLVTSLDDWISLVIALSGVVAVIGALRSYGSTPVWIVGLHIAFLALALFTTVGLVLNAVLVGAAGRPWKTRALFAAFGSWHAILQFGIPLLWSMRGISWPVLLYLPLASSSWVGYRVARRGNGAGTTLALGALWLVVGALGLAIPCASQYVPGIERGWSAFGHGIGVMFLTGALSCVWFGWYLALSLSRHGHNNEAGGAARIEDYKVILRVRLTREALTAFVIGIDRVEHDAARLKPRLIDSFTIPTPADASRAPGSSPPG